MQVHHLFQEQALPISMEEAWAFFSSPRNLDAITPPDLGFRIEYSSSERMHEGQIITYKVKILPGLWVPWVTEIKSVEEGHSFIDVQLAGPYRLWHHRHLFEPIEGGIRMTDQVHYALPFGPAGAIAHPLFVRRKLERIFGFRREMLAERFGKLSCPDLRS